MTETDPLATADADLDELDKVLGAEGPQGHLGQTPEWPALRRLLAGLVQACRAKSHAPAYDTTEQIAALCHPLIHEIQDARPDLSVRFTIEPVDQTEPDAEAPVGYWLKSDGEHWHCQHAESGAMGEPRAHRVEAANDAAHDLRERYDRKCRRVAELEDQIAAMSDVEPATATRYREDDYNGPTLILPGDGLHLRVSDAWKVHAVCSGDHGLGPVESVSLVRADPAEVSTPDHDPRESAAGLVGLIAIIDDLDESALCNGGTGEPDLTARSRTSAEVADRLRALIGVAPMWGEMPAAKPVQRTPDTVARGPDGALTRALEAATAEQFAHVLAEVGGHFPRLMVTPGLVVVERDSVNSGQGVTFSDALAAATSLDAATRGAF